MPNQANDFLSAKDVIAVVGVSLDANKYGNRVFFDLKNKGYQAYAVHPSGGKVAGQTRHKNLSALPEKPSLVVSVVRPEITLKIIQECAALNIKKIWMQPGSESPEAIGLCLQEKIDCLSDACVIIKSSDKIKNSSISKE